MFGNRFPITFLQSSIKFTNEPPLGKKLLEGLCSPGSLLVGGHIVPLFFSGMKAGLKRTFSGVTQDQLEIIGLPQWRPLLFTVAFLHTTVQVRPNQRTVCSETHQTPFINASTQNIDVHL